MTNEIKNVYRIHAELVNAYHMQSTDNVLLADFCKEFNLLIASLKPKIIQNPLAYLFKPTFDLYNRSCLDAHLHAARNYNRLMVNRIERDINLDLGNETVAVIFDYAQLLKAISQVYNLPIDTFEGNRSKNVDSYQAFKIASQFFWHPKEIRRSNALNGYTIFALRQSLELGAQEMLGIKYILKPDKKIDVYSSQIPWQFIVDRQNAYYWRLPFNPKELQTIYKWTNYFVHTGNDTMCYITGLALLSTEQIFKKIKVKNWYGDDEFVYPLEIKNHLALRNDFEDYLAKLQKPRFVEWASNPKLAYVTG